MSGAMALALPWATILDSEPTSQWDVGREDAESSSQLGPITGEARPPKRGVGVAGTLWKEPQLWSRPALSLDQDCTSFQHATEPLISAFPQLWSRFTA